MIAKRKFGNTGHLSTCTIFGAAALSNVTQVEADQTLKVLLQYGVNHIDTAAGYGESELRIGHWMKNHRQDFFLATKTHKRTYQEAHDQILTSLERLHVSSVDLLQFHNLINPKSWEKVMGSNGALKAAIEAREQGLVRYIGVTGHGYTAPEMHKRSLNRFDFDSVLLPYNYVMMQNQKYATDFKKLLNLCQERNVAFQTIKSIARRPWGDKKRTRTTWYEPFEDQLDIDHAVHWVLSTPGIFLNTGSDIHLLPKILDAANRYEVGPHDKNMQIKANKLGMAPIFDGSSLIFD
ncbi:MAG: aldo/keto reductase [Promethearchaeota archaeon]